MPKELTHFTIAGQVLELMESCWLKDCILNDIELYYIGAVAFDTPYYLNGKFRPYFQSLAAFLHGTRGENTYIPINAIFRSYQPEIPGYVLSFICGILTHIIIDSEFHPLVYFITGDYNDPNPARRVVAVCEHREWEAKLDLYFTDGLKTIDPSCLSRYLSGKRISDAELYELLQIFYFGQKEYESQIRQALKSHVRMLNHLDKRISYIFIYLINYLAFGRLYPTLALFYPSKIDPAYFKMEFSYIHPADGKQRSENIDQIKARSIKRCLDIFTRWRECDSPGAIGELLAGQKGPSLDSGKLS